LSNQIGELIKNNKITEVNKIKTKVQKLKIRIEKLSIQQAKLDKQLKEIVFSIPNIPDKSVPLGKDENDNVEIRK
jgi:seryl-tRNA synthetase